MFNRNDQKLHMGTLGRLCRRGVAFALVTAMSLSLLPATAWAAVGPLTPPAQVTDPSEFPKIEVEVNMVRSEYGTLTNTVEIALRVGPSAEDTPVRFQALATTLQINTTLIKPIDWTWVADLAPDTLPPTPIKLTDATASTYYDVQIPTKKDDTRAATGAVAQCGIVDKDNAPAGMSENVVNGDQALLFFKAESYGEFIELDEMTTLAVIRCYANPTLMNHIAIVRNADGSYTVTSDAFRDAADLGDATEPTPTDKTVTTVARLNQVVGALTDATSGVLAEGEDPLELPAGFTVVGFAEDKDIALSYSEAGLPLHYDTGTNQYYFIPGDVLGDTPAEWEQVTERISGVDYTLNAPKTANKEFRVLAVGTSDPLYSYTSNLIPAENISFTVVSKMSFADPGVDLNRYSILVFVDWDNSLLGALVVPKYENVASIVNEYISKNFVHKALQNPTAEQMASVARKDTYRGKYPYDQPREEGDPAGAPYIVPESEYKALTNKLDYAFLRRPMERAVDDQGKPTADNTWTQKLDENGDTYYDTYFPYAYGWAKCTAENYVDTWTTLGSAGELESYAVKDGVAQVTSTDTNFQIADLVKGFGRNDSTVFLKAIYEPGDSLMSRGYPYRLYTYPAYNKLNEGTNAASTGGAYSVFVQFERANEDNGPLCGTTRMREPYIRQQTTADLRWEENEDLGVDHDLPNASRRETAERTKTTYTKVDVTNSEVVDVSLTLSARQNKIDYYLTEGYQVNFVAGGERTITSLDRLDHTFTTENYDKFAKGQANFLVDNYNYYVSGESEERDPNGYFFDVVQFADKGGSHGFVLYGTLNQLMEKATRCNNGEITDDDFLGYLSIDILNDVNFRRDAGGTPISIQDLADPTLFPNSINVPQKLLDAAKAAAAHKNDDKYWDSRLDCARLTYHQLQWFILGAGLLDPATAEDSSHLLGFCHLHAACAATTSKKPKNWDDIIAAAQGDTDAQNTIGLLTAAEVEAMTHLRTNSDGAEFKTSTEFKNAVVRAVSSLDLASQPLTWENIQYAIFHPAYSPVGGGPAPVYPVTTETDTYWWYDGKAVAFNTWEDLTEIVGHATVGVTYPDGNAHTTTAKLDRLETTFATGFYANPWVSATHNLATVYDAPTDTPDLTGTFRDFRTKLVAAFAALGTSASWEQIQFYFLNNRAPVAGNAADTAAMAGYWWKDGRFKVKDVVTLLRAAQNPTGSAWMEFTFDDLYTQPGLQFRKAFDGEKYTADEFDDFKDKVIDYLSEENAATNDWAHLQYYLLYDDAISSSLALSRDAAYYWWQDGKDPYTAELSSLMYEPNSTLKAPGDRADAIAPVLGVAAFRALYNGCDSTAFAGLTDELIELGRLVSGTSGNTFDTLDKASQTLVISAAKKLIQDAVDQVLIAEGRTDVSPITALMARAINSLTWGDIQKECLGLTAGNPLPDDGWWKTLDKKPTKQNDPWVDFATLSGLVEAVAEAVTHGVGDVTAAVTALQTFLTEDMERTANMGFLGVDSKSPVTEAELLDISWKNLKYDFDNDDYGAAVWGFDNDEPFSLTWYQIQEAILLAMDGYMDDPDYAQETVLLTVPLSLVPDWVKSGIPSTTSTFHVQRIPQGVAVEVDPDTGVITTTTPDTITPLPGGLVQVQRTVTVLSPEGQILEIITMIEIYDADYNLISEQTITMPAPETPEEPDVGTGLPDGPLCTCGSEDETHAEDCPLYVAPEEPDVGTVDPVGPLCTCGSEDETHAEDCPLYVEPTEPDVGTVVPDGPQDPDEGTDDPVGPLCTCGSEDETHAEDCPLYVEPTEPDVGTNLPDGPQDPDEGTDDPVGPLCTCDAEDENHAEDCPLYVGTGLPDGPQDPDEGTDDPVGPLCTCGSEDETHAEDCPLYVEPTEPDVGTVVPDGPQETETPEPTESPEPAESPEPTPEITLEKGMEIIGKPEGTEESAEPERTGIGMEIIKSPDDPVISETDPIGGEAAAPDGPQDPDESDGDDPNVGSDPLPDLVGTEVVVTETAPPLGAAKVLRSTSVPRVYNKLTTKIVTLNRRPGTGQTKLLVRVGGANMKQLNIRRIISPPGSGGAPLLLRADTMERRLVL